MSVSKLPAHEANESAVDATVTDIETGRARRLRVDAAVRGAAPASMTELRRTLAATELRFAAALRQLERMRRRDALHQRATASLMEAVEKAQRFAYRDELTGLPNRRWLRENFAVAAALAARHDELVALLFLDLDRFKSVNDTFGHTAGDQLLQQVATRLVACVRASDSACRYGGDEFVVLLSQLRSQADAVVVADNIRAQLCAPYLIGETEIVISVSVGIAVHSGDADGYADLLRASDRAMYCDKARRSSAEESTSLAP